MNYAASNLPTPPLPVSVHYTFFSVKSTLAHLRGGEEYKKDTGRLPVLTDKTWYRLIIPQ